MELHERIRQRRLELKMSQEELAQKLGYKDRSTIAKIESGANNLTQSKIFAFANALSTTTAYLMGWEAVPSPTGKLSSPEFEDARVLEFVSMFKQLSASEQALVVAQIKGILAAHKSEHP